MCTHIPWQNPFENFEWICPRWSCFSKRSVSRIFMFGINDQWFIFANTLIANLAMKYPKLYIQETIFVCLFVKVLLFAQNSLPWYFCKAGFVQCTTLPWLMHFCWIVFLELIVCCKYQVYLNNEKNSSCKSEKSKAKKQKKGY